MKRFGTMIALSLLLVAGAATAGFKTSQAVVIGSGLANGDLGYVHNTPDTSQYIGCETYAYPNQLYGYCYAVDLAGTYKACSTTNLGMINVMSALKSDGYLLFFFDTSGNCTFVEQNTSSYERAK